MEVVAVAGLLVVLALWLAYKRGKGSVHLDNLRGEVESAKKRKDIRALADDELSDRLRKFWKD